MYDIGVTIVEHAPLAGVERTRDRIDAVLAGDRRLVADAYVLAAGAWTGPLSRLIGVPLPVRPGKGYSIDVEPYGLRSAVNLSDAKVAITPLGRNLRLAGTMEFGGLDEELNQIRVGAILKAPTTYFRDWNPPTGPVEARAGIRPMTPDGLPIIGPLGDLTNAYVSTGHGMQGVTLGPGSARALSRLILHGESPEVLVPFAPARFSKALISRLNFPARARSGAHDAVVLPRSLARIKSRHFTSTSEGVPAPHAPNSIGSRPTRRSPGTADLA